MAGFSAFVAAAPVSSFSLLEEEDEEREDLAGTIREMNGLCGKKMPFSEEITERYIKREEALLASAEQEEKALGEKMRRYRKSNRLALTWGWFFEKIIDWEDDMRSIKEVPYFSVITEVYLEKKDWMQEDFAVAARVLWDMEKRAKGRVHTPEGISGYLPFMIPLWGRMPDFTKKLVKWLNNRGISVSLAETSFLFAVLKEWLAYQKECLAGTETGQCFYKGVLDVVLLKMHEWGRGPSAQEWWIRYFYDELSSLEEYFFAEDDLRRSYIGYLLLQYILERNRSAARGFGMEIIEPEEEAGTQSGFASGTEEHKTEKEQRLSQIADALKRAKKAEEKNLFLCLAHFCDCDDTNMLPEYRLMQILDEIKEVCEEDRTIDLLDLEMFFLELCSEEEDSLSYGSKTEFYCLYPETEFSKNVLLWLTKRFFFTNKSKWHRFLVQEFLLEIASEETLLAMRYAEVFPKETLVMLMNRIRQNGEIEKMPLLIQWLYDDAR